MVDAEIIINRIKGAIPSAEIRARDLTGGGDHWQLIIVSPAFDGKSLIEQHRMVNEALKEPMGDQRIHALSLKTFSPAQWEKLGS